MEIYLTNLGKYNEGYLVGEWVHLPVSSDDLKGFFLGLVLIRSTRNFLSLIMSAIISKLTNLIVYHL